MRASVTCNTRAEPIGSSAKWRHSRRHHLGDERCAGAGQQRSNNVEYRRVYNRHLEARRIRQEAAEATTRTNGPYPIDDLTVRSHINNGEEDQYRNAGGLSFIANFTKGLRHN